MSSTQSQRPVTAASRRTLCLDSLTVGGPDAPDALQLLSIAASTGCRFVTFNLLANPATGSRGFDDDPRLIREARARCEATGVGIFLVSGFMIKAGADAGATRRRIDLGARLGAKGVLAIMREPDMNRAADEFSSLCAMGREAGLDVMLEFSPLGTLKTVQAAVEFVLGARQSNARLIVDALHLQRGGGSPADLRTLPHGLIGYAQVCDGALAWPGEEAYFHEAMYERVIPGEGELPLLDFVRALPPEVVIGAEVPLKSLSDRGVGPAERARRVMDATRALLARADASG